MKIEVLNFFQKNVYNQQNLLKNKFIRHLLFMSFNIKISNPTPIKNKQIFCKLKKS